MTDAVAVKALPKKPRRSLRLLEGLPHAGARARQLADNVPGRLVKNVQSNPIEHVSEGDMNHIVTGRVVGCIGA